jgi:glycosyltransferase involved in cell wall biosynthesis
MSHRVLHVTSGLELRAGGPAVALAGLAAGQQRAGLDVRVVASFREAGMPSVSEQLGQAGVAITSVGPCTGKFARHPDLPAAVQAAVEAADVVHIHALFEEVQHLAAQAARRRGTPYVVRPCGMLDRWSLGHNWLAKRLYMAWRLSRTLREAAAIHYTTDFERRGASHLALAAPAIIEPNGIDLAEFETLPATGSFRSRFHVRADAPLIVFLGRVHPGKGVEPLVRALGSGLLPRAWLAVVGPDSGGYLETMRAIAHRCGVADRVVFTGLLAGPERISALVDADVAAQPSDHENFGIAVAEAMAVGRPVIVSPQVGIADDVTAAGAGGVVAAEPRALAAEIARWLDDAALRAAAGARGRAFAMQRYDWSDIGRRWRGHYDTLVGRRLAA